MKALFLILGQVLNKTGTSIEYDDSALKNIVSILKHTLSDARLIYCPDWDVYRNRFVVYKKIINNRTYEVKQRTLSQLFIPMPLLCSTKYQGRMLKASFASYKNYDYKPSLPPRCSKVDFSNGSGVEIPKNIEEACGNGTNICFDYGEAQKLDLERSNLPEAVWNIYVNLMQSTGCIPGEINPEIWKQAAKTGAISARSPAIQNLNAVMFPFLKSFDGRPLWTIDFSNYHLVLCLGREAAEEITKGFDYYEKWAKNIVIRGEHPERKEVGKIFSAILNGKNSWQASNKEKRKKLSWKAERYYNVFTSLVAILSKEFPSRFRNFPDPLIDKRPKNYWNKLGADIFHKCLSAGMEEIGMKKIGLPKYDSITFSAADESEKDQFIHAWTAASEDVIGFKLPSKVTRVS